MINIMCGLRPHNGFCSGPQDPQTQLYFIPLVNNGSDCIHIKIILCTHYYFFLYIFFASKIIIIRKIMKNYAGSRGERVSRDTRLLEIKVSN